MEEKILRQYVKKEENKKTILKKLGLMAIFALVLILVQPSDFFRGQSLVISLGAILIFTALVRNMSVEYEYTLADGVFSVDAVYGVSKRKNELSIPVSSITSRANYDSCDFDVLISSANLYLELTSSDTAKGRVCFFSESESVAFVIEPNDEILSELCGGTGHDN